MFVMDRWINLRVEKANKILGSYHYKHVAIGIATKTQVNSQPEPACGFIIAYADIL